MSVPEIDDHVEIEPEDARAGQTGAHVGTIMMLSMGAALIGFVVLGFFWFA